MVDQEVLLKVYFGYFHSLYRLMEYLFGELARWPDVFFLLQKRAIRIISNVQYLANYKPLFQQLKF